MQSREGGNSGTINEQLNNSCDPESPFSDPSDSSEGYFEAQISDQFRRWANNVWNLSNNVTNRLKEFLTNNPSTDIERSNFNPENGSRDERNGSPGWINSGNLTDSSKRIDDRVNGSRPRCHHRNVPSHYRGNYFGHGAEDCCQMSGIIPHGVATFPPVLVLPRIDQGVYRQPKNCKNNIHGDEYADGWYQSYHRSGIREWGGYEEGPRAGEDYSSLSERRGISEKLLDDERSERQDPEEKLTRINSDEGKLESSDYEPVKNFFHQNPRGSDFGKYGSGCEPQRLQREEIISRNYGVNDDGKNCGQSLRASSRSKVRKVVWDMKLSDIGSRDNFSGGSTARAAATLVAKSSEHSVSMNIENESRLPLTAESGVFESSAENFIDRRKASNLKIPRKDVKKERNALVNSSRYDDDTVKSLEIARLVEAPSSIDVEDARSNGCRNQVDGIVAANSIKWSSITDNKLFDSLLESLRNRMETLANIHREDSKNLSTFIERSDNEKGVDFAVATCIPGNYLPPFFQSRNDKTDGYSVETNQGLRPSFSERIQDIWRGSGQRTRSSSPIRHRTKISFDKFNSGKDVSSKLSLLGLDRQPALREYFSEYNSAVTLARILENLIDAKSRSDISPALVPETGNPKPRFAWHQSKSGLVDVGVQNSMPMSTTACQNSTTHSRHVLFKKQHVTRERFVKTCEHRDPEILVETPCRDFDRFATQSVDAKALSTSYESYGNSSFRRGEHSGFSTQPHSIFPLNYRDFSTSASIAPNRDSASTSKRPSFVVENRRQLFPDTFDTNRNLDTLIKNRRSIDKREEILSSDHIVCKKQCERFSTLDDRKSPQQLHDSSLPFRFQANRAAEISSDDVVSPKSRSWWQKKFHFGRSSVFKGRITSLLRKVMKKYAGNYYQSENNDAEMAARKDVVVPKPPIRNKRKDQGVNRKFSKSIQWDFDATLLFSDQRMESLRGPVVNGVTVKTTGTNTIAMKSLERSSKVASNKLTNARVDSFEKGRVLDRTKSKSNGVVDVTEKLKLLESNKGGNDDDGSLPSRENFIPKDGRESSGLKTSRSLSSRLPLATGSVSPFDSTRADLSGRPSTAPISNNTLSYFLRSKVLPEDIEAGKSRDKDSSSQGSKTKVLFKHNRSSLLRANNSTLKKCAIRAFNSSRRKTTRDKDLEMLSILRSLTSSDTINEKESTRLLPVAENRSEKLDSEFEQFEENKYDGKTEELPSSADAETRDISKASSTPLSSEQKAKQSILQGTSYLDINAVLCPRVKDTKRTNKKIRNNSASSSNSQPIGPNHGTTKGNTNFFTKEKITPLSMEPRYSYGGKEKKSTPWNLSRKKEKSDYEKMKVDSVTLKGQKLARNYVAAKERETTSANLRSKKLSHERKMKSDFISLTKNDETLPKQLQEEDKLGSIEVVESKKSVDKVHPSDSDLADIDEKSIPNVLLEIPDSRFNCKTEIAIDCEARLVYSTVSKTAEHFFKQVDLPVRKTATVSPNKETGLFDRPRRDCLASKFDKNVLHGRKLLRKSFLPPETMIPELKDVSFLRAPSAFEKADSISVSKTARAASNRCKTAGNKNEPGLIKDRKTRNERNSEEMVEAMRRMLDAVISELMMNMKSEIVSSEINIGGSCSFNYAKTTVPSDEIFLIEETVFKNITNEMNETPFSSPREEKEFANSCPSSKFSGASSSEKFSVAMKSLEKNEADEIFAPLDPREDRNIKSDFGTKRFQLFEHDFCSLFSLAEILDNKPEKLRLSMVNIHIKTNVEFSESKRRADVEESNGVSKSLNSEWNSPRMTMDEDDWRNWKCEKFAGNVKIDNKVLEEKVKCSIENGVPLKRITITDPSMIKPTSRVLEKNISNVEFEKRRPRVDGISKEVLISSLDLSSDVKSEEECSNRTTWADHRIRDTKTEDFESTRSIEETEYEEMKIDESLPAVDRKDLVPITSSVVESKKKATGQQQRGTLIPRYKNIPLESSIHLESTKTI